MASRTLLITGATGKQGSSTITALLAANAPFEILALTRNPKSASAQKLLQKSPKIKLVIGDFSAIDDVFAKAKEAASAPIWGNEGTEGKKLVDAALKNNVSHFVYTSADRGVNSNTDATNVPHFITKFNIEKHLQAKSAGTPMSWTILRPVAFFENLTPDFFGKGFTTSWLLRLCHTKKLQCIATSDVGSFAAKAFMHAHEDEYKNKSIPLAGDELSFGEMKTVFEDKTGEQLPTTYLFVASILNWMVKDLGYMFKWFRDVGFGVDVKALRKANPGMKDFGTWLETESAWKKA
ncbi:NAD(P)-binding protein [Setomelanomma holmii]|uniref:NAD(P)-binding protein n=1 Tax=Setomelanomma holmii TaxID=210430 RepID=A0A9P4HL91_9PLEO|nr:NAD(P)-binding protein [Setomelanomma holmii]